MNKNFTPRFFSLKIKKAITLAFASLLFFAGNLQAQFTTLGATGAIPRHITIDAAGNVYTANQNSNTVTKITPAGFATTFATTGSGPWGITIDAIGNIYTANINANTVTKITPSGVPTTLGTTGSTPVSIVSDAAGNVYTANSTSNTVTKITPAGVSSTLGSTGGSPEDIVIDGAGNIYTANFNGGNITKITPAGSSSSFGTLPFNGASQPNFLTIDASGNIYVAITNANQVWKITPGGASSELGTTGANPEGIAVDAAGNVYTANFSGGVTKITPAGASTSLTGTGTNPWDIAVNKAIGCIYVTNSNGNSVSVACGAPLPLTLLNFTATKQNENTLLNWQTSSEINTKDFIIEHSANGKDYVQIGTVASSTDNNIEHNYHFTDNSPVAGTNYYRLKMEDENGSFTYSPVRILNFGGGGTILVYPNPAKDNISITGLEAGMQLRVVSTDGRILSTKLATGNTEKIFIDQLSKGIYFLQVTKNETLFGTSKFTHL